MNIILKKYISVTCYTFLLRYIGFCNTFEINFTVYGHDFYRPMQTTKINIALLVKRASLSPNTGIIFGVVLIMSQKCYFLIECAYYL